MPVHYGARGVGTRDYFERPRSLFERVRDADEADCLRAIKCRTTGTSDVGTSIVVLLEAALISAAAAASL